MKRILLFFVAIMAMILVAEAQAPERFSYQSVIRDAAGNLVANEPVGVRISILQYSPDGSAVYCETHNRATNANGLVTMEIGAGTLVSGSFSNIDWASGPYFLKIETDVNGGTNYTLAGTQQMLSVPYALYAAASGNGEGVSQTDFQALVGRVDSLAQIIANMNGGSGSEGGGDDGDDDSNENGGNDSTTFARIVLEAGDVWGDGTGYQILIDEDCNTTVQYAQGNLTCGQSYADWEYTIPTYAAANDEAVCVNATMDILIPAGTYDYLVTNPGCNSYGVVYVAAEQCGQTRGQSVSFEANKTYYFVPSMNGQNDCVAITVFDGITGDGSDGDNEDGQPCPGAPTVTDVDGNVYNTVQIGEQCWMRENLKTTKCANGTTIPLGTGIDYDVAYRYYPDDNSANVFDYGYLYNWAAVMNGSASSDANPSGVQGICPDGWHVPSDAEWTELENYVSSQSQYVCGSSTSKIAKALASEEGWNSSTENCAVGNNPIANNATGFSARPAGSYYSNFGNTANFWSATQYDSYHAYYRFLNYGDASVNWNYTPKDNGDAVRCVRD